MFSNFHIYLKELKHYHHPLLTPFTLATKKPAYIFGGDAKNKVTLGNNPSLYKTQYNLQYGVQSTIT